MKKIKIAIFIIAALLIGLPLSWYIAGPKNTDPLKIELITSDLENFWIAFDKSTPDFNPHLFQQYYIDKGSKGLDGFMDSRIQSAEHLASVVKSHYNYYNSIRKSTDSIDLMKDRIRTSLVKLKTLYVDAIFPPVYFVVGGLNAGGTSFRNGLIIGAEMYGLTPGTPKEELTDWHKSVIKPIGQIPHIVAHELVHFQQNKNLLNLLNSRNLLSECIKEGSADFVAELISGKHINQHVHDWANPKEKELWLEFKERMLLRDYSGWISSSQDGRPNDLGYWIGYKITKSFYDLASDKKAAIIEIIETRDAKKFLERSKYAEKFTAAQTN